MERKTGEIAVFEQFDTGPKFGLTIARVRDIGQSSKEGEREVKGYLTTIWDSMMCHT